MNCVVSLKPLLAALCISLAACTSTIEQASRPIAEVEEVFEAPVRNVDPATYRLGPKDVIAIRTFRENDLSFEELVVDSTGAIAFPLVGRVQAEGLTAFELADRIEAGLARSYLRSPDVTVVVKQVAQARFVVQGAVVQSGIFELEADTTLLAAIARARGTNDVASRDDVVIFRNIDGQRMGALFDVNAIERGYQDDPVIVAGDTIVVHTDGARRSYLELLRASPLAAGIFRAL